MRRARGFTLLEVLLATTLLATALALAFATLRAAGATVQRGEAMAERNERMRAVTGFLRQRIASADGIVFATDRTAGTPLRFVGDAGRMRFVAELPNYLGQGGPHLHELRVLDGALEVGFRMVLAGEAIEDTRARAPEPLAEGLRSVAFAYQTYDASGEPGQWREEWTQPEALPLRVRVRIADGQGAWPELVVALPMAAAHGMAERGAP